VRTPLPYLSIVAHVCRLKSSDAMWAVMLPYKSDIYGSLYDYDRLLYFFHDRVVLDSERSVVSGILSRIMIAIGTLVEKAPGCVAIVPEARDAQLFPDLWT